MELKAFTSEATTIKGLGFGVILVHINRLLSQLAINPNTRFLNPEP